MGKILNAVRLAWILSWAALATLLVFFPIILVSMISRTGNLAFSISKIWARLMLAVCFVRAEIVHRERIEPGRSYIIISNHQSLFDILALVTTLGVQFRWVIKRELLRIPLFGYALYAARNIFIDRGNSAKAIASINRGLSRLPAGASVMVFAEGTRSPDGAIHDFKKGGFVMAVTRHIPILPVTVNGSRRVLAKGSTAVRPGSIRVVVGEPIDTSAYREEIIPELIARTKETVTANFDPGFPGRD
ncbi:MAG: 1-acyl-sn-glycerol-3-phosphate acyltransferase [Spirochaetes bacterium]|nr:MAG: 1-acyl-sn-glycerol-3-phosphate acyltransferase [Spirochaetota bacterium]